jgi:hypothetical protein
VNEEIEENTRTDDVGSEGVFDKGKRRRIKKRKRKIKKKRKTKTKKRLAFCNFRSQIIPETNRKRRRSKN